MIRPIECAHHNYMIWEQTIDGYLRSHNWATDPECSVPLHVSPETATQFQTLYRELGWKVSFTERKGGVHLHFHIPENLVPRA